MGHQRNPRDESWHGHREPPIIQGYHDPLIDKSKVTYCLTVLNAPAMLFVKVTFFIMYLSIFGQWRWMRIAATAGGAFTASFYTAVTACLFAFMTPGRHETWQEKQFSFYWGHTFSPKFRVATSSVGLAIDLLILILPLVAVSKLQMPLCRKLGLSVIFMTGILYVQPYFLSICLHPALTFCQSMSGIGLERGQQCETRRHSRLNLACNARLHH